MYTVYMSIFVLINNVFHLNTEKLYLCYIFRKNINYLCIFSHARENLKQNVNNKGKMVVKIITKR